MRVRRVSWRVKYASYSRMGFECQRFLQKELLQAGAPLLRLKGTRCQRLQSQEIVHLETEEPLKIFGQVSLQPNASESGSTLDHDALSHLRPYRGHPEPDQSTSRARICTLQSQKSNVRTSSFPRADFSPASRCSPPTPLAMPFRTSFSATRALISRAADLPAAARSSLRRSNTAMREARARAPKTRESGGGGEAEQTA